MASATSDIHNVVLTSFTILKFTSVAGCEIRFGNCLSLLLKLHIPKDGRHALRYGDKVTILFIGIQLNFSIFECFVVDTGCCMHMQ